MRIIDLELLQIVRQLPCMACHAVGTNHPHHITSRGAGGSDTAQNVIPLCAEHHSLWHQEGPGHMAKNYPSIYHWLKMAGREDVFQRISKSQDVDWERLYGTE